MNTQQQKIATKYLVRIGVACFIMLPPYIIWWKENQMLKMGKGVKDDIERMRLKEKSLLDIERKYKPTDLSYRNPQQRNDLTKEVDFNLNDIDDDD